MIHMSLDRYSYKIPIVSIFLITLFSFVPGAKAQKNSSAGYTIRTFAPDTNYVEDPVTGDLRIVISMHSPDTVFTAVDTWPEFQGGAQELNTYLITNIRYPEAELKQGISEKIMVNFVITKNGQVKDVRAIPNSPGNINLLNEARRVIEYMPPWKAGKLNGRPVNVEMSLPVEFKPGNARPVR